MKTASDALRIVTQEDAELAKRPSAQTVEPVEGDAVDPAILMDLLGDIDGLKLEIQERMRRIEAVKQAKSVLLEDAMRTETLNRKLAALGKVMHSARSVVAVGDGGDEDSALLPWRRPEAAEGLDARQKATEDPTAVDAGIQSMKREFTAAYEAAGKRLEEAEQFWQKGEQAAREAQKLVDQTTAELLQARSAEETATADLQSARQELTTAYQFASVAAQRRLDSAAHFHKATQWMIYSSALSWIAVSWMGWIPFRGMIPVWGPGGATAAILLLAMYVGKRRGRESENE